MSTPTCASTLEARRERAVQRAITRACQRPSDSRMRMVEVLQGSPTEYYEIPPDAIRSMPQDYAVDGVRTASRDDAIELIRDRYGLTDREARGVLSDARSRGPWGGA